MSFKRRCSRTLNGVQQRWPGRLGTIKHPREHIEVDPDRHSGTPVIRGRRLPTSLVAAIASAKDGRTTLREDYGLSKAEIDDAVGYEHDVAELAA